MKPFVTYDAVTGQILSSGYGFAPESAHIIYGEGKAPTHYVDLETKEIKEKSPSPGFGYSWDYIQKDWVLDKTSLDYAARLRRKELLTSCDWTQLPDVPLETRNAWAMYRQALRDITDQAEYPFVINWPLSP